MQRIKILIFLILIIPQVSKAQNYKQRANFIYRYMKLVTWPPSSFEGAGFVIGVYGDKNKGIAKTFRESLGIRELFRRKIIVKTVNTAREVTEDCQAVFIPRGSIGQTHIPKFLNYPILIFTEAPNMGEKGSSINFIALTGSEYEINTGQMDRGGLTYKAKLKEFRKGVETITADKFLKPTIDPDSVRRAIQAKNDSIQKIARKNEEALRDSLERLGFNQKDIDSITQKYQEQGKLLGLVKQQERQQEELVKQQKKLLEQAKEARKQQEENQALYTVIYIISVVLLLIIVTVLFITGRARKKQRNEIIKQNNLLEISQKETETKNVLLNKKNTEIEEQHRLLEQSKKITDEKNIQLHNQREMLKERNKEITEKNNQITDSIRYAQTIQNAVLPDLEESSYLKDYFLLYIPKDIVSGDFYWTTKTEDKTVLIVADSTGHGVPGAFLSMVGADLFNEIIIAQKNYDPSKILEKLHWGLFKRLNQDKEENKDGMDVCICVVEKISSLKIKVTFSGAKRPLFYTQNGELKRLQGDKTYIGGIKQKEVFFSNQYLFLQEDDVLYLTTDGYVDTPNPQKRKFGTGNFIKLLEEIKSLDIKEQGRILEEKLHEYRNNTPIRDDTTLLAVKLS